MIRVLVVDDHAMVRSGLSALLEASGDITVVGQASDGRGAVTAALDHQPDVVLMDLSMPVMDGAEATREVLAVAPDSKVVVLTSFSDRDRVNAALRSGAVGYQLKDASRPSCLPPCGPRPPGTPRSTRASPGCCCRPPGSSPVTG